MLLRALNKIEAVRPFREVEAWTLFRLAAFGEAVGWTLLITAISINRYRLPGHAYVVPIAGQIHGTLFLIYFGILLATYSSLRWQRSTFLLAAVAGVLPYGTLLFEYWAAYKRKVKSQKAFVSSILLATIT